MRDDCETRHDKRRGARRFAERFCRALRRFCAMMRSSLIVLCAGAGLALQLPSVVTRRAALESAGAALAASFAVAAPAGAFDIPPLDQFEDLKARAKFAQMPNPKGLKKQVSSAMYAITTGDLPSLKKMVDAGWDLTAATDDAGKTALHRAAQLGSTGAAEVLIGGKVNLDAVTLYKDTPLHMAARNNRVDFVKQLVAAGADKTKVNMAGDTPAMLAARYKFEGVIDALK